MVTHANAGRTIGLPNHTAKHAAQYAYTAGTDGTASEKWLSPQQKIPWGTKFHGTNIGLPDRQPILPRLFPFKKVRIYACRVIRTLQNGARSIDLQGNYEIIRELQHLAFNTSANESAAYYHSSYTLRSDLIMKNLSYIITARFLLRAEARANLAALRDV